MKAQHRSSPEGRLAFAQLCERYWFPLYAYVRSVGNDVHRAQDLTQGFFERVMEKNYIGDADPSRGRFRTFLLTSLTNYLANEHDRRMAKKRGGNLQHLSLEFEDAERRYSIDPPSHLAVEKQFDQQWARSLLDRVIDQLREEFHKADKQNEFSELKQFLMVGEPEPAIDVAKRLEMTESAVRVSVHRMRRRYREMLRAEIATTLDDTDEIDAEISALFRAFALG